MLPGWNRVQIADIPADVFDPGPGTPPFALLWLHDEAGDTPATNPILTAELRARKLACVAPDGGASWWLDRVCPAFHPVLTPEQHLLDSVIPWIQSRWRQVAVAGVGMGGQGAVRLGLRHPDRVPVVASVAGAFDFHERYGAGTPLDAMYASREHARQDTAILHVSAHDWPPHIWFACPPGHEWYRGNDRLHEKLAAIGVPHVADLDTQSTPEQLVAPMLAFAIAALERESRRLA
jgi:S-formylglutathione hydrolase FrmB